MKTIYPLYFLPVCVMYGDGGSERALRGTTEPVRRAFGGHETAPRALHGRVLQVVRTIV